MSKNVKEILESYGRVWVEKMNSWETGDSMMITRVGEGRLPIVWVWKGCDDLDHLMKILQVKVMETVMEIEDE